MFSGEHEGKHHLAKTKPKTRPLQLRSGGRGGGLAHLVPRSSVELHQCVREQHVDDALDPQQEERGAEPEDVEAHPPEATNERAAGGKGSSAHRGFIKSEQIGSTIDSVLRPSEQDPKINFIRFVDTVLKINSTRDKRYLSNQDERIFGSFFIYSIRVK